MSNHQAEIGTLNAILHDTLTELERSTDESERNVLSLYYQYIEARIARLRAQLDS